MTETTQAAQQDAIESVRRCMTSEGFKASGAATGYTQVWTRDSMLSLLGLSLAGDVEINQAIKTTLQTIAAHQTSRGLVPDNVNTQAGRATFQAYADAGLWYVIGASVMGIQDESVRKTLEWYRYQEVHNNYLISMPEGGDWEDLFAVRDRGLTINVLHVLALRAAGGVADKQGDVARAQEYDEHADRIAEKINQSFWYRGDGDVLPHIRDAFGSLVFDTSGRDQLGRQMVPPTKTLLVRDQYYLPYLTLWGFGEWFDSLGNLLAIISGVASDRQAEQIVQCISEHQLAEPQPIQSLYPVIEPGHADWRPYYTFGNLNLPHQYHNGGAWPYIGALYVAALVKMGKRAQAAEELEKLAELNVRGEFPEWLHGQTGEARGMKHQLWSASLYLYAYHAVEQGVIPHFN